MAVRVSRVLLVRHGRATAGWDVDPDPGLDDLGREQAEAMATSVAALGPLRLISSPLRRCRETASALERAWGIDAVIESRVAEIPSPEGIAMADRVEWLRDAMRGDWTLMGARYTDYRDAAVQAIRELALADGDTVVCSHFVAINAIIGGVTADDRVLIRSLDNCSITVVEAVGGVLRLVEGGREAETLIR